MAKDHPELVLALFNSGAVSNTSPTTNSIKLPNNKPELESIPRPEKSLLTGATGGEQSAYMEKIREYTYKKLGVET